MCPNIAAGPFVLESTLKCPECGHAKTETMPKDACQWFYECEQCHAMFKPKPALPTHSGERQTVGVLRLIEPYFAELLLG